MTDILSTKNMRESDRATIEGGVPSRTLMQRAGLSVKKCVEWRAPVGIVCGVGNNAGDGFVVASALLKDGIDCHIFLLEDRFSPDGKFFFDEAVASGVPYSFFSSETDLKGYKTLVDCIFGTGFRGEAEGIAKTAIEAINTSGSFVVSVDINSGLGGDSGMSTLAVHSDLTVSIGSYKSGHFLGMAKDYMKKKINVPIGITPIHPPYKLFETADAARICTPRANYSNKSTYGYITLIGGSSKYSGAIRLSSMANAAMRSGAGVATIAAPSAIADYIIPNILEATLFPLSHKDGEVAFNKDEIDTLIRRSKVIAIGMGIGLSGACRDILLYLLKHYHGVLIIDADGLNALSTIDEETIKSSGARIILTPHNMEFSRLCGKNISEIVNDPIPSVIQYATRIGCTLLLKGPSTIISDGERVFIVERGCAGMATAGSGDVLSGVLAATCGWCNKDTTIATALAAFICGRAGEIAEEQYGSISMIASDTVSSIPKVILELERTECDSL